MRCLTFMKPLKSAPYSSASLLYSSCHRRETRQINARETSHLFMRPASFIHEVLSLNDLALVYGGTGTGEDNRDGKRPDEIFSSPGLFLCADPLCVFITVAVVVLMKSMSLSIFS